MMPSKEAPDGGISSSRLGNLESPFLGELFAWESGTYSQEPLAALEATSLFRAAFESHAHAEAQGPVDEEAPTPCLGVIGQDDRVQVQTAWKSPYRWICQISGRMRKNGKLQRFGPVGTGVLISPSYVLTAAHLLRDSEKDGRSQWVDWVAEELVVTPARNEDAPGDLKGPFGRFAVRGWKFAPGYDPRAADSWRHDYAIIELKEPAGAVRKPVLNHRPLCFWGSEDCGNGTRLEVVAPQDVEGQTAYTAGYPYDRGGGHRLMLASGRLSGVDVKGRREIMDFKADVCKGQSGSPIWITRENRLCLVGIVTKGGTGRDGVTGRVVSNRAIRFSREVFDQISKWFEAVKETPWLGAGEIGDELESGESPEAAVEEALASEPLEREWHPEELESYQKEPREMPEDAMTGEEESGFVGVDEYEAEPPRQEVDNEAEDFGTFEDHLDDAERPGYDEEKPYGELFEYDSSQGSALGSFDARLVIHTPAIATAPVALALLVNRWGEAERKKISGVRLALFECDVGESGRTDAAAAQNVQMAEFLLELAPNPAFVTAPGGGGIPRVSVVAARWANPTLEKSYKATKSADLILKLGGGSFPLWISRQDIHEEGRAVEVGFALEDGAGNRVERMSIARGEVVSIPVPDYLGDLLGIPGRFDDPMRDSTIDMDGTRFDEFIRSRNRREFITRWLEDHPALREAANESGADLKTSDINKAWFILHDVGATASLTDRRFKADQPRTKAGAVHGYLNRNGYYAATHDFTKNRQGTVYEFLSKNGFKIANGRTINIETVPDIEPDVADKPDGQRGEPSSTEQYASIGYRRLRKKVGKKIVRSTTYYKWTTTALDVLADLYVFASARARHLLTITVHKEVDRNLGQSVIWREYSAAEIRKAGGGTHLGKARDNPHDYHGDPYGFNVQALYDLITQKLNALGGKRMPSGARYGIHPRRVCKVDGEDITNGSHHLHVFPHQSDPEVKVDTGLKKPGWWNAKQLAKETESVEQQYSVTELDSGEADLQSEEALDNSTFLLEGEAGPEPLFEREWEQQKEKIKVKVKDKDTNKEKEETVEKVIFEKGVFTTPDKDEPTNISVQAFRFKGASAQVALIFAGVHGTEPQGVVVANLIVDELKKAVRGGKRPQFTTIIIPELIKSRRPASNLRNVLFDGKEIEPNRNFPRPGESYATARTRGQSRTDKAELLDSCDRPLAGPLVTHRMLAENRILIQLIEREKPSRATSIHAHSAPGRRGDGPGIFVDPRGDFDPCSDQPKTAQGKGDDQLTVTMVNTALAKLTLPLKDDGQKALTHPMHGNFADHFTNKIPLSPSMTVHYTSTAHPAGTSFGMWAPSVGLTTITMELPQFRNAGKALKILSATYAQVLIDKFLGGLVGP